MTARLTRALAAPIALAMFAALGTAPEARADFRVRLTSGASVLEFIDVDMDNEITFSGTLNGIDVAGGLSQTNTPGGTNAFVFDEVTFDNNPGTAKSITVEVSATDFTSPPGPDLVGNVSGTLLLSAASVSGASADADVDFFIDDPNTIYGTGALIASSGASVTRPGTPSAAIPQTFGSVTATSPYALTLVATIDLSAGAVLNFDSTGEVVAAVPEPSSFAMAALAVPIVTLGLRARRRKA